MRHYTWETRIVNTVLRVRLAPRTTRRIGAHVHDLSYHRDGAGAAWGGQDDYLPPESLSDAALPSRRLADAPPCGRADSVPHASRRAPHRGRRRSLPAGDAWPASG